MTDGGRVTAPIRLSLCGLLALDAKLLIEPPPNIPTSAQGLTDMTARNLSQSPTEVFGRAKITLR